jgi:hypothetical protein
MDNGLIFPYRLYCAHAEPGDANRPNLPTPFGASEEEHENRTGIRQAMG